MRKVLFVPLFIFVVLTFGDLAYGDIMQVPVEKGKRNARQRHEITLSVQGPDANGLVRYIVNLDKEGSRAYSGSSLVLKKHGKVLLSAYLQVHEDKDHIKQFFIKLHTSLAQLATFKIYFSVSKKHWRDDAVYEVNLGSYVENKKKLKTTGFDEIKIKPKDESREFIRKWAPDSKIEDYITLATIEAIKPKA